MYVSYLYNSIFSLILVLSPTVWSDWDSFTTQQLSWVGRCGMGFRDWSLITGRGGGVTKREGAGWGQKKV